jgi:chromosome partitioning protein
MSDANSAKKTFKIFSTGTLKGGVGKSNVLFNLVGLLAEKLLRKALEALGYSKEQQDALIVEATTTGDNRKLEEILKSYQGACRILLIDADPQFNLTNNIGIDVRTPGLRTTQQIFEEANPRPEDLIYRSPIPGLPNIDIIPASLFLTKTEINLVSRTGREFIFFNFVRNNLAFFNKNYVYLCCDTNPNLYMINQNMFMASDDVIIVSDCSYNSISGAEFFMALWSELKAPLQVPDNYRAIIVNKYDTRPNKRSGDFVEYCNDPENESIAEMMIKQYIPLNERIADTETAHMPINILSVKTSSERESKNKAIAAYQGVMEELTERGILYA